MAKVEGQVGKVAKKAFRFSSGLPAVQSVLVKSPQERLGTSLKIDKEICEEDSLIHHNKSSNLLIRCLPLIQVNRVYPRGHFVREVPGDLQDPRVRAGHQNL